MLYYNSKSIFHFFSPNFNYSSHIFKKAKISLFKIFCRRCKREIQEDFLQEDEPESRRLRWRAHNAITSPEPIRRHNHHNKRYINKSNMVKLWLKDYQVVTLTAIQMGNRSPSWYQDGCSIQSNLSFYHFFDNRSYKSFSISASEYEIVINTI